MMLDTNTKMPGVEIPNGWAQRSVRRSERARSCACTA